jgi:DNA-binding NtrC family response regulator
MTKIAKASTILLLEDEPRVACALAYMITTLGHAIIQVNDVKLAQQVFRDNDEINAIVADYRMNTDFTGLDFLVWARAKRPGVKRILISGQNLRAKTAEIADICHNFLPKPFEIVDLENALEEQVSQAS